MIVNNSYKFLFVHIQKTTGMSIRRSLSELQYNVKLNNAHSFINTINIKDYLNHFKFCFVRNPWDRLVSWYNMFLNKGSHNEFSKYILTSKNFSEFLDKTDIINDSDCDVKKTNNYPKSISFNQLDYVSDNDDNVLVDFIGRYENINEDFKFISDKLNVKLNLTHINKFNHDNYKTYYKDSDIEKVYNMYKRDIDYFGYEF